MENKAAWHHRVPTAEEAEQILKDLEERKEAIRQTTAERKEVAAEAEQETENKAEGGGGHE